MIYDESPSWSKSQIQRLAHPDIYSDSDLLRLAIYTNAMHGSGREMTTLKPEPTVTLWQGMDSEPTYHQNMNASSQRALLQQWGWDTTEISYQLNSWGFRSEGCREFDTVSEPSLITLGCSFTFGTGLPESVIWPRVTADSLGLRLINLGTGGHGLTLGTRWLLTEGDCIPNPAAIAVLIPPPGRITWINRYGDNVIGNTFSMTDFQHYALLVNNIDLNSFSTYMADIAAIRLWARSKNIPVAIFEGFPCSAGQHGLARDLRHHGVPWHTVAADTVRSKLVDML